MKDMNLNGTNINIKGETGKEKKSDLSFSLTGIIPGNANIDEKGNITGLF